MNKIFQLSLLISLFFLQTAFAEWSSWRGPWQNGYSPAEDLISSWSREGENLVWRADFVGRSTPLVFDGRVYVIGRTGQGITMQEHIACFDAGNGKLLWERKFNVYHTTVPFNRVGWASLAGDPETGNIYAHGVGGLLICLNKSGETVWIHSLTEEYGHISGYGGRTDTPVVDEDLVILGFVNSSWGDQAAIRHRFFAFDKRDGTLRWVSSPGGMPYDFNVYSTPVVGVIGGQRLLIGGNGDGSIYALKVRTGEKVWGFQLSKRGINSSVVVDGNRVFATHSEENVDQATMGRIVCIDGTGKGDITKTHETWRHDDVEAGYASPAIHDGKLYVVDNSANLRALDAGTGKEIWRFKLGSVGKGSPVIADGKLYVTEVNGRFHILQISDQGAKSLDEEKINMPAGRYAEIYGSPAVAYNRIYFTTEEGIYCLGDKSKKFTVTESPAVKRPEETKPSQEVASIHVVPAEVLLKPGSTQNFRVRSFDAAGNFLKEVAAKWSVAAVSGKVDEKGSLVIDSKVAGQAGTISADVNGKTATARIRVIPDLPWSYDFENVEAGKAPVYWIGAGKFQVKEIDGNKVLAKPVAQRGLQTADIYMGPASMKNYTVQADVRAAKLKRRMPDIGLIASGYTMSLLGGHQRLQILSWAAELRVEKTMDFAWNPDAWYTMKMRVDMQDKKGIIRGKVWQTGTLEPQDWTIVAEDPLPVEQGSPGLYGNSSAELYFDNVKVAVSK